VGRVWTAVVAWVSLAVPAAVLLGGPSTAPTSANSAGVGIHVDDAGSSPLAGLDMTSGLLTPRGNSHLTCTYAVRSFSGSIGGWERT
jgi:hypothetical protein